MLGRREIAGRTGTLLEGESGANDPVGIALMVSLLGATRRRLARRRARASASSRCRWPSAPRSGSLGGLAAARLMRRVPLPNEALYPLRTLAFALPRSTALATPPTAPASSRCSSPASWSGDARAPYKREIERFASALASLGEIVAFVVLGLTVSLSDVLVDAARGLDRAGHGRSAGPRGAPAAGRARAAAPVRLTRGERAFVLWAGLKGAVPILLGTYVLAAGVPDAARIYGVVFVVVLVSVLVQGGLVPAVARLGAVPMRVVEPEPWALGMRFRDEPSGLRRYHVADGRGRGRRDDRRPGRSARTPGSAWSAGTVSSCRSAARPCCAAVTRCCCSPTRASIWTRSSPVSAAEGPASGGFGWVVLVAGPASLLLSAGPQAGQELLVVVRVLATPRRFGEACGRTGHGRRGHRPAGGPRSATRSRRAPGAG